jgi:Mg/Co/Ni transporter MgtE
MITSRDRERLAAGTPREAAGLLARMHADDAADLLGEMSEARRRSVMAALPEHAGRRIRIMLGEQPPTAAGLMSRGFVALHERATVGDALDRVRASGLDPESVAVVFVCSDQGRLVGSVALKRLLEAPAKAPLRDVEQFARHLRADATFEEIARLITDFDLPAAAVVDERARLIGAITTDDVLELMMPDRWRRRPRLEPS